MTKPLPVARVQTGKSLLRSVAVYGHAKGGELGIATIELSGDLEGLQCMLPETAEQLADALRLAARQARGEQIPTALDDFLARRAR
jgi:hypothetical protein